MTSNLFTIIFALIGSSEATKDMHDDPRDTFESHPQTQQPQLGHTVLHPGLSRPLGSLQSGGGQRNLPQGPHHPGKETRPSVIESSQPHIIECT